MKNILLAWLLNNVTVYNHTRLEHLARKVRVIYNKEKVTKASDTLGGFFQQGIIPAWKINYILRTLEGTTISDQEKILCILQLNYSPTLQLPQYKAALEDTN